ncbi:MAG: DMT family transporter [Planctomycetes bacterium]|nr:DMT family transporter [Planctomycetota bacterium]
MTRATRGSFSASAFLALLGGALGISFAPIFVEFGSRADGLGPSAAGFWRMSLAGVVFLALGRRVSRPDSGPDGRGLFALLLCAGVCFAGDLIAWHWSFHYTNLANATLLANCSTVFVVLAGWLLFGERFRSLFVVGAALAIIGVVFLLGAGARDDAATLRGDLLGLLTAIFYGGYLIAVKVLRRRVSTVTIMQATCITSAPILGAAAWIADETILPHSASGWGAMIGLALVSQCMGQALIAMALATLPAGFAAVTLLFQPVVVALLQWVFFDKVLLPGQLLAGAVVLVGIGMARVGSRPPRS